MEFSYTVNVSVERSEGKFASRDELGEQIQQALDDANPDSLEGENGGTYEITDWEVEENVPVKPEPKRKKKAEPPAEVVPGISVEDAGQRTREWFANHKPNDFTF